MINRASQRAGLVPSLVRKGFSEMRQWKPRTKRRDVSRPTAWHLGAAHQLNPLLLGPSVLFSVLQEEVDAITSALSWAILVGNALASFLFLWAALRETPRHWPSVLGSGSMLLLALLSGLTFIHVLLPGPAHTSLLPVLLPVASSALIAGLYTLTTPPRRLTRRQRTLLVFLLVGTGATLLALVLLVR
jgi:hypothetical protein